MKIMIITGASSGMGKEFVTYLDQKCNDVDEIWTIARRAKDVSFPNTKAKIVPLAYDLTKEVDMKALADRLEVHKPSIKVLVNCAGFGKVGPFGEISIASQSEMVQLNDVALMQMCYHCIPYMVAGGYIINLASSAAFLPQMRFAVYAASKSFVLSFSKALHYELKDRGISVTAVCPGPVDTEFFAVAEENGRSFGFKSFFMAKPDKVVKHAVFCAQNRKQVAIYGASMKGFNLLCKVIPHRLIMDVYDQMI